MITDPLKPIEPEMDISDKMVLIIDDYQAMRSVFRDILRSCGADVRKISMAASGSEAIASLNKSQFDIVLCDFNLGPGKNGQQVLEEAKFKGLVGLDCIWIMVTAEKTADAVTGAAEYQPDAYLLKPVAEAVLNSRLLKVWKKKQAFMDIYQAMKQLNYPKAINLCDERLTKDKANAAELLRTKCDLLFASGELDRAKELLEKILIERDLPWAKASLAKILIKNKKYDVARLLLEETVAVNPSFLEAHDLLVETLQAMSDFDGANSVLERAVKLSPNSVARQKSLGEVSLKMGNLEEAERAFKKSVALGENSVLKTEGAYIGLAKVYSENDNADEAFKVLGQLNKSFDTKAIRLKVLAVEGMVYHKCGNEEKAKLIAEELSQSLSKDHVDHDSEKSLEMARLFMATGHTEKAVALLQREVKNSPENIVLLNEINEVFVAAEMAEEGAKLVETSRQEAMEMMNLGVLLVSKGQYKEAIDAMRNAREVMPTNVRVLLNLAYVLIAYLQKNETTSGLIREARDSLLAANARSPGEARFVRLMDALNKLPPPI
ncbi:MAG: response regulator [Nitrosomonas sp.]|nr:response regulator [Nitrosomonas sp.]